MSKIIGNTVGTPTLRPDWAETNEKSSAYIENKPTAANGNFLVGNGKGNLKEMTPEEVLSHINGASVMTLTIAEYEALISEEINANTLYMITDAEDKLVGKNVEGEEFSFLYGNNVPVTYVAEQGAEIFNDYENNIASGLYSHAEGFNTRAIGEYSHVQGKYNIEDMNEEYAHIVGNGTSDTNRSNAHTIDWDGNAWFAGNITVGGGRIGGLTVAPSADTDAVNRAYVDSVVQYVTPQMFGAKGDGVTDDTAAVQAALDNSSFVYIPDGEYLIEATHNGYTDNEEGGIKPNSGQTIIMSQNATLKSKQNNTGFYNIINIYNVDNVKIVGGRIKGERNEHIGTEHEHGYGISVRGSNNIVLDNMEICDCWGDSIIVGYIGYTNSKNVKIYNCKLHGSRRQGISIVGGIDVVIRDCEIYNISGVAPEYGIDIEPDGTTGIEGGVAENIIIDGCHIYNCTGGSVLVSRTATNYTINTVRANNCKLDKVIFAGGDNLVFTNNTVDDIVLQSEYTIVANSEINNKLFTYGGSGNFYNCRFYNKKKSNIIEIDVGNYPSQIIDILNFNNCYFKTYDGASRMLLAGVKTVVDNKMPVKIIKFVSCNMNMAANCYMANAWPSEEIVFDGCEITFNWTPYEVFGLHYGKASKLSVRDTIISTAGSVDYLIALENFAMYRIELYNNRFPELKNFVYCSSDSASGEVMVFNSPINKTNLRNGGNGWSVKIANDDTQTIVNTVLASLPIYDGGVS